MDAARLFDLANAGALIGWLMLAFAPLGRGWLVTGARAVGVLLAVLYSGLLIGAVAGGGMGEGDFTSLAGVTALFARPEGVLVGWVHYLAFDLWVGAWAVEDAHRRGLKHAFVLPCLVFVFLAGPLGLLLYLAARTGLARDKTFA
jgi:hypothetical protein